MFGPLAGKVKLNHCLIVVAVISVYSVSAGYKEASKPASMKKEPASKAESQDQTPVVQDFCDTNVTSREGLEARPSSVPGAASGLFTTKALKAGDFLGFYCGRMVPVEKQDEVTDDEWKYAAGVTKRMTVVADTINYPERDKMALVNEAPYPGGKGPNVAGLIYDVFHEGQKFSASAYYVTRDVKADGELFVYYGNRYEEHRKKEGYTQPYFFPVPLENIQDPQSVLTTIPSNCFAEADR